MLGSVAEAGGAVAERERVAEWIPTRTGVPGRSVHLSPALSGPAAAALLALVEQDTIDSLPRLGTSHRAVVGRLVVDGRSYVVKRYLNPRLFLLKTLGQRSKAEREALSLEMIAARTGNPIEPIAWGEERAWGMSPRSWLVTSELVDSVDLRRLRRSDDPAERAAVKEAVLRSLPGLLARLHASGVVANNLMAKNVLLQPGTGTLALIDQPHAHGGAAPLPERLRRWDLACLFRELRHGLSPEETRSFLRDYLEALGFGAADLDRACADLQRAVARRAHETPVRHLWHRLRGWFKRTRVGQAAIGHRYDEDERGAA